MSLSHLLGCPLCGGIERMGSEENCSAVFSYFLLVRWARRRGSESLGHFTYNVLMLMELGFVTALSAQFSRR